MKKLEIELTCPACKRKFVQRVEDMRPGRNRSCPNCKGIIEFTGDDGRRAQRAMDDLMKEMKKLGKVTFK